MLGHDAWRARFGGDSGVLGRTLVLDGRPHVVVGVLPRGFRLLGERSGTPDFWVPAGQEEWDNHANNRNYRGVARLAPGVTLDAARREMDAFFRARPGTATPPPATGARVEEVRRRVVEPVRAPLLVLFAAAGLLLLATCANVATLLLGEAVGREGEIATRVALGASRGRVARQLLTEHVLLAALGAALGVAVALAATRALVALAPPSMPRAGEVGVSARSLAFALAAALLTAALFGLAPLLALVRAAPGVVLRAAASRGSRARGRLQWVGAGVQIALSVVLLVGAALFGRSLAALSAVDPGFRPEGLLWVRATLPRDAYATAERRRAFHERAVAAIAALPGVGAASAGLGVPFGDGPSATTILVADTPGSAEPVEADAQFRVVLPGFLETLGVPLQVGRPVTRADGAGAPRVVLVNETFARRFWPSSTALGKRVQVDDLWYEVVGIVGDVRHGTLRRGAEPTFYLPAAQTERWGFSIVVRAACRAERDGCAPARLAPSVRRAIQALDANVPVPDAEPVTALVARTLSDDRYRTMVVTFFALAAAALAAVGVYGVTVCAVNQRLRELAIRMALGASHGSLLRAVIGATAAVAAVGAVAGAGAAAVASRALPRFLFGVAPTDAATYVGVVGAVLGVAVLAGWLPARRAARADPATIMRAE
jgi:putative ABC transport system permease protein